MSTTIPEFWTLLRESRLVPPKQCEQYESDFARMKGVAEAGSTKLLAEWLTAEKAITSYQAKVLRAGAAGPFEYAGYLVDEQIESGRFEGMYHATHVATGHEVLLSFIAGEVARTPSMWAAAAGETAAAQAAVHPHVSRLFELIDLTSFKLSVVENLEGKTLADLLKDDGKLPPAEACRIARLVAQALAFLHENGQVHGALRPRNIWIDRRGGVKLLHLPFSRELGKGLPKFDLAKAESEQEMREAADYLAPELAAAGSIPSTLTDTYALGCTLYELLNGRPPFEGGAIADKARRHAGEAIAPLPDVDAGLTQAVSYLMAKDPSLRYQQMHLAVDALTPFVDPSDLQAPPPHSPSTLPAFEKYLAGRKVAAAQLAEQPPEAPVVQDWVQAGPGGAAVVVEKSASGENGRPAGRRENQGPSAAALIGWLAAGVFALVAILLIAFPPRGSEPAEHPTPPVVKKVTKTTRYTKNSEDVPKTQADIGSDSTKPPIQPASDDEPPSIESRERTIDDDGATLWASPTTGPPVRIKWLPISSQVFIAMRPADLLASVEGRRVLESLGPGGQRWVAWLEQKTGLKASEVEQVVVGMLFPGTDQIEASLVVTPAEQVDASNLLARWNNPAAQTHAGQTYYTQGNSAYLFLPDNADGQFAVAPRRLIGELIDGRGAGPILGREMEKLLADSDADRHLTVLFAPHFIFGDGKSIFAGVDALREPMFFFLADDETRAALFSAHLDENFFLEMSFRGVIDVKQREMAERFQNRLDALPDRVESFIASINAHPYGRQVLNRFPGMIRYMNRYIRVGTEGDRSLLRAYQPAIAAHNLILGTELALAQLSGAPTQVAAGQTPKAADTIAERLQQPVSLSFQRDTLEQSLKLLSEEIDVPIEIAGGDLELDGITKNQSFGIDLRDQPAEKALLEIMLLANPDKTVTKPTEPNQKLVFVIQQEANGGRILVTTRKQAEKRGDKLPEVFVP